MYLKTSLTALSSRMGLLSQFPSNLDDSWSKHSLFLCLNDGLLVVWI